MINNIELYGFLHAGWCQTEIITAQNGDKTIYQGKCSDGNGLESEPIWCIKRITITTVGGTQTIIEQFADGDMNFDNIWQSRTQLTYKYL